MKLIDGCKCSVTQFPALGFYSFVVVAVFWLLFIDKYTLSIVSFETTLVEE